MLLSVKQLKKNHFVISFLPSCSANTSWMRQRVTVLDSLREPMMSEAGKKESTGRHLNQACLPYATLS
jgi:hypothetical protein